MNPIVYHIVSGHAWFSGIGLLLLAVVLDQRSLPETSNHLLQKFGNLIWLGAVLLMVLSSVAAPVWAYVWLCVSLTAWLWSSSRRANVRKALHQSQRIEPLSASPAIQASADRWHRTACGLLALSLISAIVVELPYHFRPKLEPVADVALTIIGDSVTAGVGGNETSERWPEILQRVHRLRIQDISHMGETAKSATKRLSKFEVDSSVVIIEIGGNDVLGGTSVADFDRDLSKLLQTVCVDNRQVVMFELPLPPFFHGYGYVQRRLATKYGVQLLPKTMFLSAIAGTDATLDSIHLTQAGHQRMAETVWSVVKPAFRNAK